MISETQFKNRQGNIVLDIASDQILKSKDLSKKIKVFQNVFGTCCNGKFFPKKKHLI